MSTTEKSTTDKIERSPKAQRDIADTRVLADALAAYLRKLLSKGGGHDGMADGHV